MQMQIQTQTQIKTTNIFKEKRQKVFRHGQPLQCVVVHAIWQKMDYLKSIFLSAAKPTTCTVFTYLTLFLKEQFKTKPTLAHIYIDDHQRNPKINDRDHLVGQLTGPTQHCCDILYTPLERILLKKKVSIRRGHPHKALSPT